jgi:hypothetical protein
MSSPTSNPDLCLSSLLASARLLQHADPGISAECASADDDDKDKASWSIRRHQGRARSSFPGLAAVQVGLAAQTASACLSCECASRY